MTCGPGPGAGTRERNRFVARKAEHGGLECLGETKEASTCVVCLRGPTTATPETPAGYGEEPEPGVGQRRKRQAAAAKRHHSGPWPRPAKTKPVGARRTQNLTLTGQGDVAQEEPPPPPTTTAPTSEGDEETGEATTPAGEEGLAAADAETTESGASTGAVAPAASAQNCILPCPSTTGLIV